MLDAFTEETGIEVEVIQGGDAGTVVNQAILTNGNPQADVLFGIDSTFLSRALDEELFVAHEAEGLDEVDEALLPRPRRTASRRSTTATCASTTTRPTSRSTTSPVPTSLDDLTDPAYADLLVVENPATSSPGLAFLLATIEAFGEDGWEEWWSDLRDNGVRGGRRLGGGLLLVVLRRRSASEGDRPLVVSYASSPPAEVRLRRPAGRRVAHRA